MSENNTNQAVEQKYKSKFGIKMDKLSSEFTLSKSFIDQYTRDFPDLDNLVDGVSLNKDKDAPFVGDTTVGSFVRSIPRSSLQQLPVFSATVNGTKNSITALFCTYMLKERAFNEQTFGKGLLSTLQIGGEQAISHGFAPFLAASGQMYNDFGSNLRLLHYTDTSPEPGISDANESGYHWVVAHLTETRVKRIRDAAAKNPNTSWNVGALNRVLESTPRAKSYSPFQSNVQSNGAGDEAGPTYEFRTRYESGIAKPTIITYCPDVDDEPLREVQSNSKFGYPRINYLVIDPAALHPFGVSRVRLSSPNQNLMNIYLGNIASMLLLNSKPPIFTRGRFPNPVQLKQGVRWHSPDTNASAELMNLDNGALESFPTIASHFATQIQNMMGVAGTPGTQASKTISKTGPGVKQQQELMDISTNQITKIYENFLRQYALVHLDILFSEQTDVEKIIVDDETKNAMNQVQPGFIGDDNKMEVNWKKMYKEIEKWSVEIDVSLSKDELDERKRGDLQDMLVVLAQNAQELGPEAVQKVKEITDMLMEQKAPLIKPFSDNPIMPPAPVQQPVSQPEVAPVAA